MRIGSLKNAVFCALLVSGTLYSGWADADPAPMHIAKEIPGARLAGRGTYRWFGLKLYDAQMWVGQQNYRPEAPTAARFALDLRYARNFQGQKIAQASIDEMKKIGIGTVAQYSDWLEKMDKLFPDVVDGNHITGVYLPDQGARFYLDGKLLGDVADAEFARAFFAIWLDPRTSAQSLRTALLTGATAN